MNSFAEVDGKICLCARVFIFIFYVYVNWVLQIHVNAILDAKGNKSTKKVFILAIFVVMKV